MRLLKLGACGELSLTKNFVEEDIPPYAILSHTWGEDGDEVTFKDLENGSGKSKLGYDKIQFCGEQARKDGLQYFWVDTCCIDKTSNNELSEAITSMFRWYHDAVKCYVYLSDVSARKRDNNGQIRRTWESAFRISRWFTRGWTLQELLAPKSVELFSREGKFLGDKKMLEQQIHEITGIPITALHGSPLSHFSIDERMRWAAKRDTKRKEDKAYCLLGIFDIFMPLIYGEGENAFIRLKEEINKRSRSKLDEGTTKSLNDLKITDPEEDMMRIELSKDRLLEDCCKWILQDPNFQAWHGTDTTSLLWINGAPGKGKTMLMIALVRELLNNAHKNSSAVSFFFCQNTDIRLNNAASILRGLIWKLATEYPQLVMYIHDKYKPGKQLLSGPNAIISLFSILSAMLDDCPRTFLLIDALDECNSGVERDQLLGLIIEHANSSSKAKWLLASRNYPEIKQWLESESRILSLELNEQHISNAVASFIERKTSDLAKTKKYSPDLKEKVKKKLTSKADSTFLWVALACKSLFDVKVTRRKTLSTLKKLPSGLKDLYARMMKQVLQGVDKEDRDFCLQILRSVSVAFRPLSTEELITIAELPTELLEDDGLSELIDLCGSFIIIRDRMLYFVHQSAKDYLVGDGAQKLFAAGLQQYHGIAVGRSLHAMSGTLKRDMCNLRHPGSPPSKAEIDTSLKAISYACSFWVEHLVSYLNNSTDSLRYQEYLSDRGCVHQFLCKHLLHWFEALSLIGEIDRGIMGLHSLDRMIGETLTKSPSEIALSHKSFVHDAVRVFRQCRPAVEEAPLQIYCSALIFSPENSLVRQNFKKESPRWISPLPRTPKEWSPCLQTLEGHTGSVWSVAFSPDGQQLSSASIDRSVRLWDAVTGAHLRTLEGHTASVNSVTFSPDSQQLASASHDRTVRLWDAATGARLQTLEGHTASINSVTFSPDGQQLASASYDRTVRLWNAATGAHLQTLEGHTDSINSVTFSPNGQQLASTSRDRSIRLWDTATGAHLRALKSHTGWINSVTFSPDGQQLGSASDDRSVRLWNAVTGAHLRALEGHTDSVNSVTFSPDGQQLASASYECTVWLWDVATGAHLRTLEGHTDSVNWVTFSPDGQQLASASYDCTVRLWDAATGVHLRTLEDHTDSVNSVRFSPDGQQLASVSHDRTVRLWDAATDAHLQTLEGHTDSVILVTFSPNGQQLASASYDRTVRLWDAATGARLQTLEGHTDSIISVTFSPDGQQLASASHDRTVRLWDAATGAHLRALEGHTDSVISVTFSPDGQQLASASDDRTVRLWNAATGAHLRVLEGHTDSINSVTFSPDGQQLASASDDRSVRLWNAMTGAHLRALEGHTDSVNLVTFSPDGHQLAASDDRSVRLWDAATGICLQALEGHMKSIAFSPDGSKLITDCGVLSVRQIPQSNYTPKWIGYCIEIENKWITWNGNNILWLPSEYRRSASAIKKDRIGIGCISGVVHILNFCPGILPH